MAWDHTVWMLTLWNCPTPSLQWGAVLAASFTAAMCDMAKGRIPNRLTGPLWLAGLAWASWWAGAAGLADAAAASAMLASPLFLLFVFAGGGAGDVKLMAALGAWLGLVNAVVALAAVLLSGMVLGAAWAAAHGRLRPVLANLSALGWRLAVFVGSRGRAGAIEGDKAAPGPMLPMPYGLAIFLGMLLAAGGVLVWRA